MRLPLLTRALLLALVLPLGCADAGSSHVPPESDEGTGQTSGATSTGTSSTGDDATGADTATTSSSATEEDTDTDDSGGTFVSNDAAPSCGTECDIWNSDDCPEGEKCTALACEAGSTSWDTNICRPIGGDGQAGEPCMGAGVDGLDDCATGFMCWDANPDTGLGYCIQFCKGSPINPICPEAHYCRVYGNGVIPHCVPLCDPLAPDCPNPSNLCIPVPDDSGFECLLDASGGLGTYGTPCGFSNTCNHGLLCIAADAVPASDCMDSTSCCSPVCDLTLPNTCPGAAQGQQCLPYYEPPDVPPGYEDVGICAVPTEP